VAAEISRLRALTQRSRTLEPVRDTQRTFRVLLDAMARPGTIHQLPVASDGAPVNPWLATTLLTLLDHEVGLAVEAFPGSDALELYVRQRTAARPVTVDQADFVVSSWDMLDASLPVRLRQGTLEYPNDSATVLILVPPLAASQEGTGLRLDLDGPGVPAGHQVWIGGLSPALFVARDEIAEYPCGIDLMLIDPAGQMLALPRSAAIQVVVADGSSNAPAGR
jgi:alpha-D-ribose 1-methylphosphonate 5-triphosphate synthase subunit PhnH